MCDSRPYKTNGLKPQCKEPKCDLNRNVVSRNAPVWTQAKVTMPGFTQEQAHAIWTGIAPLSNHMSFFAVRFEAIHFALPQFTPQKAFIYFWHRSISRVLSIGTNTGIGEILVPEATVYTALSAKNCLFGPAQSKLAI